MFALGDAAEESRRDAGRSGTPSNVIWLIAVVRIPETTTAHLTILLRHERPSRVSVKLDNTRTDLILHRELH
jgi:hypothetical protein